MSERLKDFARAVRPLLVAFWLGAAIFFSAVVAPAAFGVLRGFGLPNSNEIAGAIVSRSLAVINIGGFAAGITLVLTALVLKGRRGLTLFVELIALLIMTVTTGVGQWIISARMISLRTALQVPIDQIAPGDPRRMAFDDLHHYSVLSLSAAMIAAIVALVMMRLRRV